MFEPESTLVVVEETRKRHGLKHNIEKILQRNDERIDPRLTEIHRKERMLVGIANERQAEPLFPLGLRLQFDHVVLDKLERLIGASRAHSIHQIVAHEIELVATSERTVGGGSGGGAAGF